MKKLYYFGLKNQEFFFHSWIGGLIICLFSAFFIYIGVDSIMIGEYFSALLSIVVGVCLGLIGLSAIYEHIEKVKLNYRKEKKSFLFTKYEDKYKDKLILIREPTKENLDWKIIEATPIWGLGYFKYELLNTISDNEVESDLLNNNK